MTAAFAVACLLGGGGATQATAAPEDAIWPIYVDPVNGDDTTGDGHSWGTALKTIPAAVAKSDTADYYKDRRVQVTLAEGTYVLDSTISMKSRTSLVGDPDCDRSKIVLTAPVDEESGYGLIANGQGLVTMADPDDDFVCTLANLTISNVMIATGTAMISCGYRSTHDRWSQVVTNVVVTHCVNTNDFFSNSAVGVSAGGRSLVVDCLFSDLQLSQYCLVGWCANGGWFRNCRIENCTYGGAGLIANVGTKCEYSVVEGCTFSNNTCTAGAGCVQNVSAVRDCLFADNYGTSGSAAGTWNTDGDGYFTESPPLVSGCTFLRNVATNGVGGALTFYRGGTVTNCTFVGNKCRGGVVQMATSVVDCTFEGNRSVCGIVSEGGGAGALHLKYGRPRVASCRFVGNSIDDSARGGGAIRGTSCPMDVVNCTFEGNSGKLGGAVNAAAGTTISNCVFSGNAAISGGGIFFESFDEGTLVSHCVFTNNLAGGGGDSLSGGGGLYARAWASEKELLLTVRNCLFVGNALTNETKAGVGSAAAMLTQNSETAFMRVESCTIVGNRAVCGKPAALAVVDTAPGTLVTNCVIACNYGEGGSYAPGYASNYGSVHTSNMAARVGYSYLHHKDSHTDWWTGLNVVNTDELPPFKSGTWIPAKKSALCDTGIFQDWMTGAFDLQRNANGKAFATRVYGAAPDMGAFERVPTDGFTVIVR